MFIVHKKLAGIVHILYSMMGSSDFFSWRKESYGKEHCPWDETRTLKRKVKLKSC